MDTANIKVMVVDDHEVIRDGVKFLIESTANMEVVGEAGSGEMAVVMARQLMPDVILMDFNLPEINGIVASWQIMHDNPDIKILMASGHLDMAIIEQALHAGVMGLMSKLSVSRELIRAICTVHKGHKFCCPQVMRIRQESTSVD